MNACAQHGIADIGFHGSSLKAGTNVLPALQVLLGGGPLGDGAGRVADKVIKIPSKRGPQALRVLLNDFGDHQEEGEYYINYYVRKGEKYFYHLLKPLADLSTVVNDDFVDWEHEEKFETAIGVGECAVVRIDLISTLLHEAEEKLTWAKETFEKNYFADTIYHSYNVFVSIAKALLLEKEVSCNSQISIINDFDKHFTQQGAFQFDTDFKAHVLRINQHVPEEAFAKTYLQDVHLFLQQAKEYRQTQAPSLISTDEFILNEKIK